MNKIFRTVLFLLCFSLFLCGCAKEEEKEESAEPAFHLEGKTYFNTEEEYGNEKHSRVWFGKDGSFVLNDNYYGGKGEVKGTWSLKEDVVTLDVKESSSGRYSKILFEVRDEDTIVLKTALEGSKFDQVFSTKEVTGPTVDGSKLTVKDAAGRTYYNASQSNKNKSFFEMNEDGSMRLGDCNDLSIMEIEGSYEINDELICIIKFEPAGAFGEDVRGIFFLYEKPGVLMLCTDLGISKTGDYFTLDGTLPE